MYHNTIRHNTQEKNEKIDKKIKHFECLHWFFYFKSVKLPIAEDTLKKTVVEEEVIEDDQE